MQQSKHTPAFHTLCFPSSTHVNSEAGSAAQPRSLANSSDSCVQEYSHDSTLGEGQVLHQDVKTSVLIVEELPDPPVKYGEVNRMPNENSTPTAQRYNEHP